MKRMDRWSRSAAALAAVLALTAAAGCVSYADDDYEGLAYLAPDTVRLQLFDVRASDVVPLECYESWECPSGYVCYDGYCVPAYGSAYCDAVLYCVCPQIAGSYPTCASDVALMSEDDCLSIVSSFPECMP
ncbi:MAG: hypothetical protein JXB32_17080 [Deltaproteobacteria bacterium]|nr:hypothetical protein [Deltaproteobacteria bacterium]